MERSKEHDRVDGRWYLRVQSDGSLLPPSDEDIGWAGLIKAMIAQPLGHPYPLSLSRMVVANQRGAMFNPSRWAGNWKKNYGAVDPVFRYISI